MTPQQKIKYLQSYIHFMKGVRVEIRTPANDKHTVLMNQAYVHALTNMTRMGKKIHV